MMERNPRQRSTLAWGILLASVVVSTLAADSLGQVRITPRARRLPVVAAPFRAPAKEKEDAVEKVFLSADRSILKKLAESRKLLATGRFGEAVRNLDAILEGPEDFFFEPDNNSGQSRGLKAEAQRLIGQMPQEGRDLYELQYGARARQMLSEALAAGDVTALSEVSRRFFHTRSGYEATFLLGLHHFDHGRPLVGALTLHRLFETERSMEEFEPSLSLTIASCWLQAGMTDKAREALVALRERHPSLRVAVAGRETPIFADNSKAVEWLVKLIGTQPTTTALMADSWLMFRGDSSRNASMLGSAPLLNMRWRVQSTDDPQVESLLEQCQKTYAELGSPTIPSLHPLAVGDVLLMRTLQNLLAVDFATGKRLWEVPIDKPANSSSAAVATDAQQILQMRNAAAANVGQRIWSDMAYGTLSSDGRYVFSVEDAATDSASGASRSLRQVIWAGGGGRGARVVVNPNVNNEQPSLCNQLAAHDIRTGKLKWQLGGPSGPRALRQPDTFFLGPPLPLLGQLFVLAETKGEIRLLALETATGNVLWSQQLASSEPDALQDSQRRWTGVSPSYADGVLVCPTSAGAVVGVELATRSLLWGYCFNREQSNRRNGNMPVMMVDPSTGEPSPTHWIDDSISIRDSRVLATPVDSNSLFCLSLINGELLWKCPRKDDLYVACVDRDKAVLVGRRAVRAVRLADGKPAWDGRVVDLPADSSPSGRGFASGNRYYLPLSSAEVVGIDLSTAKIVQVSKSRKGTVPGNLVCFKGNVVSQGLEGVDAYYQLDTVLADIHRRLAANPNDAEALSLQGEILLDDGKPSEAIASFRLACKIESNPRTRELLRDTLLEGLRTDFAAHRAEVPEIEPLLDDASQRAAFLRAMGKGLRQAGEAMAAFDCYQKLIDLEPDRRPLDRIDKSLNVRRDRWIRSQLAELRSEAKDETAAQIDQAVAARLQSSLSAASIEPLQRFFDSFGDQPAAATAREELVKRLKGAGRRLEAELTATPNAAQRADVDRATAKPTAAEWPVGKVEASTVSAKNNARRSYNRGVLNLRGRPAPFLRDLSLQFDYNQRSITANDGDGREAWRVSLAEDKQQQNISFNASTTHGASNGHLLVLALGWKIFAIDTLGLEPNGSPRVLWTQDLTGKAFDGANDAMQMQMNWQMQQQLSQGHDQGTLLGPVCHDYVCFQQFRSIVAVDPKNGETLWVRQNMPSNCRLFGDDQYVFVLPPDKDEATVLRATDGEFVGTRRVPRISGQQTLPNGEQKTVFGSFEEACLATLGRNMLLWWPKGNQRELTLVDPFEGRDLWRGQKFAANAHTCIVNDEVVGVMEPSGRFVLVSLSDGRTIADLKLQPETSLTEISLFASGDQYFLLTFGSQNENRVQFQPMPGCQYKPIYQGRLYAIDRQGKLQWPAPVAIKNQFLLTSQPSRLPVVAFGSLRYVHKLNGETRYKASVLCVDKRNGRIVYKETFDNNPGVCNITGDAAKKTVDLVMQQDTIRLTFTDKPIPPPAKAKGKSPTATAVRALWNSVQRVLGSDDDIEGDE